jgi:hypothetical protein
MPGVRGADPEAVVAKLSADGSTLLWSTYLGDVGRGLVRDLDIDAAGAVYAAFSNVGNLGSLVSSESTLVGNTDCALIKLSSNGSQRLYGTYLGGSGTSVSHNPSVRHHPLQDEWWLRSGVQIGLFEKIAAHRGSACSAASSLSASRSFRVAP